jgi:hypothetical protein
LPWASWPSSASACLPFSSAKPRTRWRACRAKAWLDLAYLAGVGTLWGRRASYRASVARVRRTLLGVLPRAAGGRPFSPSLRARRRPGLRRRPETIPCRSPAPRCSSGEGKAGRTRPPAGLVYVSPPPKSKRRSCCARPGAGSPGSVPRTRAVPSRPRDCVEWVSGGGAAPDDETIQDAIALLRPSRQSRLGSRSSEQVSQGSARSARYEEACLPFYASIATNAATRGFRIAPTVGGEPQERIRPFRSRMAPTTLIRPL